MIKKLLFICLQINIFFMFTTSLCMAADPCLDPGYNQCVCDVGKPCTIKIQSMISKILSITNILQGEKYTCTFKQIECSEGVDINELSYSKLKGGPGIEFSSQDPSGTLINNEFLINAEQSPYPEGVAGGNLNNSNFLPASSMCSMILECQQQI